MSEYSKPHRFDKFARKVGESMIEAIRVTISVFSSPDKERWPAVKLLVYLKGAEELARDMLREIAEKIFVYPPPARAAAAVERSLRPETEGAIRAPYFRLGVKPEKDNSPETRDAPATLGPSPEAADAAEPEGRTSNAQAQRPGEAGTAASTIEKRISALEDVLTHPGKHAARMARAIYRAEHEDGTRLIARSYNELMLDHGDFLASDPAYSRSEAAWRMQQLFIDPG